MTVAIFLAGLYRNIPILSVVWDPYEKKERERERKQKHSSQCGPGHCAPSNTTAASTQGGVASEKSVKTNNPALTAAIMS